MSNTNLRRNRPWSRKTFLFGSLAALIHLLAGEADRPRADVVILKDGYSIHGKIVEEQVVISDPLSGEQIVVKRANGFSTVDDGPRWTIFSAKYKALGDVNEFNKFQDYVRLTHVKYTKASTQLPRVLVFHGQTEFDKNWRRVLTFATDVPAPVKIEQQLLVLTPHYARIDAINYNWNTYYLTRELGFTRVRDLLKNHPDLIEQKGPDVDKRTKIIRFLIQADWLNEAEEEIKVLAEALPGEAKRVEQLRADIQDIRNERLVADLERARESGRHGYALATLKRLPPKEKLAPKLADRVLAVRVEYETAVQKFDDARRHLAAVRAEMKGDNAVLGTALDGILKEIHMDTVGRLDNFTTLAAQSERDLKKGKTPLYTPEKLAAAGISGWLQGNNSSQTEVNFARKLLYARDMSLDYLRLDAGGKRAALLNEYEKDPNALPYDELEKLISLLPPPMAEANLPSSPVERKTEILPVVGESVKYLLQLPPEYQHGRPYPLLLVLPGRDGKDRNPRAILESIGELAAKHGYVVAVVDRGIDGYGHTAEEIAVATGLIRHMRRTYQIDSDRVFMMGFGEGATMAMDVAAGHPDLFAGIVPIGPVPSHRFMILAEYWSNFQNLPVYLVMGDRAGETIKTVRKVYEKWMGLGYPALCVSYKGRGNDQFDQEMPFIFDWMSRKTRASAIPAAGVGQEFHTVRECDNRFYWLSTEEIAKPFLASENPKATGIARAAHISGKIVEGNVISVSPLGLNKLTIWVGKGMIDFAKPVTVRVDQREPFKKVLTPRISVLLEDLYERGDRQRPALQKIDLWNLNGIIKASSQ